MGLSNQKECAINTHSNTDEAQNNYMLTETCQDKKMSAYYIIPFTLVLENAKLTHSDRNEISGCQGTEWGITKQHAFTPSER